MTDQERITQLEARIAQLEARLASVEARPAATTITFPPAGGPATPPWFSPFTYNQSPSVAVDG